MKYQKKSIHYTCIACVTIDAAMTMGKKKNYQQVYLGECKYKMNHTKMSKFIETELESESELGSELESYTELESKSELEPGAE